jgi:hypothetical protein
LRHPPDEGANPLNNQLTNSDHSLLNDHIFIEGAGMMAEKNVFVNPPSRTPSGMEK